MDGTFKFFRRCLVLIIGRRRNSPEKDFDRAGVGIHLGMGPVGPELVRC